MESQLDALRLKSLEERLRTSERWTKLSMFGWVVALILMLALMSTGNVHARDAQPDKLRVRELTIVDGEGRERIVIAAPLPDPVMNGKGQSGCGSLQRVFNLKVQRTRRHHSLGRRLVYVRYRRRNRSRTRAFVLHTNAWIGEFIIQGENNKEIVSPLIPTGSRSRQSWQRALGILRPSLQLNKV